MAQGERTRLRARLMERVGNECVMDATSLESGYDWWPLALKHEAAHQPGTQPELIVCPKTAAEVAAVLQICSAEGAGVTAYGGGSGVAGAAIPTAGGVLLDLVHLRNVREIDRKNLLVTAEAGMVGGHLEEQLRAQGYTLGIYPQSLTLSTVGGWVATRATGSHSGHYGDIEQRLAGVEVALVDGTLARTPLMPHWALGPNLSHLFVGAEGTLGVVTAVTLRMVRRPRQRLLRAALFPELEDGLAALRMFAQEGLRPAVVQLHDVEETKRRHDLFEHPQAGCLLLLGFEGPERLTALEEELTLEVCRARGAIDLGRGPAERWDAHRLSVPTEYATLRTPGVMADVIDIQAHWDRLEETYRAVSRALLAHCGSVSAHFSHVTPQGSAIIFSFAIEATDDEEAVRRYLLAWDAAMAAVFTKGATIAHHQGIGLARARWFAAALGDAWPIWERLKQAFDPSGILNPGKLEESEEQPATPPAELVNG